MAVPASLARPPAAGQLVVTATLVEPCEAPALSSKRTKTRDVPGEKAIAPLELAKIEKVGVAPAAKSIATEAAGGARHWPVEAV